MNVNVVANPLKTFKVKHNIVRDKSNPQQKDFEFSTDLFPNYFDIRTGVWNIAISQAITTNNLQSSSVSTLFNVSTNLLSHAVTDPYFKIDKKIKPSKRLLPQIASRNVVLATFGMYKIKYNEMQLERISSLIFFQIDNAPRSAFMVRYYELTDVKACDIDIELTFLFQRLI